MSVIAIMNSLLNVPTLDPDEARRAKLLNILLSGVLVCTLAVLVATIGVDIANVYPPERVSLLYIAVLGVSVGIVGIYAINRYWKSWLANSLFLLMLLILATFVDEPQEVADGRTLLWYAIPIFGASLLVRPYASFAMAAASCVAIASVGLTNDVTPSPFAMIYFFAIALVSWLAARGLEQAVRDLRILNRELDQRVQDRTRQLAESLSKTEAILESTADGIIVFDAQGKATVANHSIADLLAYPLEQIVDQNIDSLMHENVTPQDREMLNQLLLNKEMEEPSIKFAWSKKIIAASVAPVVLETGEEIGTVAVFRDFTKEAEIDRMKSTFVSLASHELRTPLNAILGYSEMLKEGVYGELSDRQEDVAGRILANTHHMLSLANNLLDRAQIEAGTITLNISAFAPTKLIEDVVTAMEILAKNRGLELQGDITEDVPPMLSGDQQRVSQIIVNLIGNALKFTKEGGVYVHAYVHDKDHWAVDVSDTGIGISKEAREYIFEPFRQADESPTREHGGAGLGLSIVKQLVEMMDGRIELESTIGAGSTFTVILPIVSPKI
jgi:PAS domain S-box-containing protein